MQVRRWKRRWTCCQSTRRHPRLKTHKLKGDKQDLLSCSAGYDLRVVFQIVEHEKAEAILLLTVGTHEEVY
jgi:mRNA-degrading endonuclease YafQ of YafQ-DinJ toxin-antitoxin module